MKMTFLGTGYAMAQNCYNTCFTIYNDNKYLLVDAGGGNQIFNQLSSVDISFNDINALFITHAHTDHILGVIWVIRKIASMINDNKYNGVFDIYLHQESYEIVDFMCKRMLTKKLNKAVEERMNFHILKDHDKYVINNINYEFFDILSTKALQYGFKATLADNRTICCLGDEPANKENYDFVKDADYLLCEAFCLYKDKDRFKPYEKHHTTALDGGILASQVNCKNLIMYHSEDKTLNTRKELYTKEALENYNGNVFVPDDLESIEI